MISSIFLLRSRSSSSSMVFIDALSSAVDLDPVVAERAPLVQVHEPQAGRSLDRAGIEQNRRYLDLALHLVEQLGHVIDTGRHRRDARQKGDALGRIQAREP